MLVVKASDIKGVKIPAPYERVIKVLFAPDLNNVSEINFSIALISPFSQTDLHTHDRSELIFVISGEGEATLDDEKFKIEPDLAMWIPANTAHQIKNPYEDIIKIATVFVPAYNSNEIVQERLSVIEK